MCNVCICVSACKYSEGLGGLQLAENRLILSAGGQLLRIHAMLPYPHKSCHYITNHILQIEVHKLVHTNT